MSGEKQNQHPRDLGPTPEHLGTGVYPVKVDDQCEPVRLEPERVKHLS
jgi:hypothetical protein